MQAGSLSMPGGRRLKENLYSLDSAPDVCVRFCVFVCEYLDTCVYFRMFVCVCTRLS